MIKYKMRKVIGRCKRFTSGNYNCKSYVNYVIVIIKVKQMQTESKMIFGLGPGPTTFMQKFGGKQQPSIMATLYFKTLI